jgi:hypothetical protein
MLQRALGQFLGYRSQFSGCPVLDEACTPFLAASDAARDDAMVARWSANPLGMLWPVMSADGGGLTATARRPTIIIAAWLKREQSRDGARPAVLGRPSLPAVGHAPWERFRPAVLPEAGGRAAGSDRRSSAAEALGLAAGPNHHESY